VEDTFFTSELGTLIVGNVLKLKSLFNESGDGRTMLPQRNMPEDPQAMVETL